MVFTKGTFALTSWPARFIAAAAAAALASIAAETGTGLDPDEGPEAAAGAGAGVEDGVEEDDLGMKRDMAALAPFAAAALRLGPAAAEGPGMDVRELVGVQECDVECRCEGQKERPQACVLASEHSTILPILQRAEL